MSSILYLQLILTIGKIRQCDDRFLSIIHTRVYYCARCIYH